MIEYKIKKYWDTIAYCMAVLLFIFVGIWFVIVIIKLSGNIILVAFFPYGYGVITTINCFYDNNETQKINTQILNHWTDEGNYYLQVNVLGQSGKENIVSISEELYNETKINDTIKVYLHAGLFNIPYFKLGK